MIIVLLFGICICIHKKQFSAFYTCSFSIMDRLNGIAYQPGQACSEDDFKLILRMDNLPPTLYPTGPVDVMEAAQSDFAPVCVDYIDTLTIEQGKRRIECDNIRTMFDEANAGLNQMKRDLDAFCAEKTIEVREKVAVLKRQKVEVLGLIDQIEAQDKLIDDDQVKLDELESERRIDVFTQRAITDFEIRYASSFVELVKQHFYTAYGPGAENCAKTRLMAPRIVSLVKRMVHIRALGKYLTREQVSDVYDSLDLGAQVDPVNHLFGESDYDNYSSQFLASALVEGGGGGDRIMVSRHVFYKSSYGVGQVPGQAVV